MINTFLFQIAEGEAIPVIDWGDILIYTSTFSDIIVNVIVIIGGILGLSYIKRMREKQSDATFSYLMRLNIRLKYFKIIFEKYRDDIMGRFYPENFRREPSVERMNLVDETIQNLSQQAEETLNFLRNEDNQLPAKKGWIENINQFIDLLISCEQLKNREYFIWTENEDIEKEKERHYEEIMKIINTLLKMVNERQKELENKLFKNENT